MLSGKLDKKIIIQRESLIPIEMNEEKKEYIFFSDAWASIMPVKMENRNSNNIYYTEATHEIKIRFIPGINNKMRIVYGLRTFEITGVIDIDEQKKEYLLIAKEVFS